MSGLLKPLQTARTSNRSLQKMNSDIEIGIAKVAILMCTMNGEPYLVEQLKSFENQTHIGWQLWVSDDGSIDQTTGILETYRSRWVGNRCEITKGPRQGHAANFLSLACNADISADHYAYSDQDDIWLSNKLALALQWLSTVPPDTPALYCSRTELVDAKGKHIGYSGSFVRTPSFLNALTQNLGGGNTMVFNNAARKLLVLAGADVNVVAHDWWTYLVVTGCGGQVFFDPTPTLLYRQHDRNLIGANHTFIAPFISIWRLHEGRFQVWNTQNINALQKLSAFLSPDNRTALMIFSQARNLRFFPRLFGLWKAGVYRQTILGNIGLFVAAALKRI